MCNDIIFEKYTILENLNWKGTFKDGHLFVREFIPELKGYKVSGIGDKNKIITLFLLKEDIDKCQVITSSKNLDNYILEMKGK